MPWYSIPDLHSISDSYPICHHFLTTTLRGWVCMHHVHHYPTWMLAFDCISFCIYMHRYPIRSLHFVSIILHRHLAFTCTIVLYGHYVLSLLSYTYIWHLRAPLSHTVATFHLCYPTRTLHFVCTAIPCGCYIFSVIQMDDPIFVHSYSMRMLRSFTPILHHTMQFAWLRIPWFDIVYVQLTAYSIWILLSYTDVHILITHILLHISFMCSIMYIILHTSTLRAYSIAPIRDGTYSTVYIFSRIFHYVFICIACVRCSLIQLYTLISRILYVCSVIWYGVHVLIAYIPLFLLLLTSTVILYTCHVYSTAPGTPALLSHTNAETPIVHMFPHASLHSFYFVFIYPMFVILCLFTVYVPLIWTSYMSVHSERLCVYLLCVASSCITFCFFFSPLF